MSKIYVVEDEEDIREMVMYALNSAGFETAGFRYGEDFYVSLGTEPDTPSLVVLDIMLPECDGLTLLKRIRNNSRFKTLPVIMLTAKSAEVDKIKGLDLGADDYITKPFSVMELISRVHAVLRRTAAASEPDDAMVYENIKLDSARRAVYADGERVKLTFKEYELLHYFLSNSGLVLSREKIMGAVWGFDFEGESRTIDIHIRSLRLKLGAAGGLIKTVRNVGYMLGV